MVGALGPEDRTFCSLVPGDLLLFQVSLVLVTRTLIFVVRQVPRFEWCHGVLVQDKCERISLTFRFGHVTRNDAKQYIGAVGPVLLDECQKITGFAMVY